MPFTPSTIPFPRMLAFKLFSKGTALLFGIFCRIRYIPQPRLHIPQPLFHLLQGGTVLLQLIFQLIEFSLGTVHHLLPL